ncbi:MAG: DNA helicase RecQ [Alphaproteobacteria bacterium]|nr:DNA helicase RecQ [Alphaproteobacteria bacterium]MBL7098649.1 DNA helicase RecQ [Alphaproteobacteria bacterium]
MSLAARDAKHQVLKDIFGFDGFRPGQETVMDAVLSGRHVLTVMPTGSGKSLCYQVPSLVMGGLTIVVSPLVALMQDQVAALRLAGVAADAINSAIDRGDNVAAWRRAAAGDTRLLYLAPERLMTERMIAALKKLDIRLIAVDEAHCISQWGPAFRPEYEALAQLREAFPRVPIIALTATADEVTRSDIASRLFDGKAETVVLGFDRPNIRLTVQPKHDGKKQLLHFLQSHRGESGIVYCLSRNKTEQTAEFLNRSGVRALAYHAGMDKDLRDANQNAFMTERAIVMVATIAFGMGIDKSDVRFVFHMDLPGSLEAYYQEIGRAGRDGAAADAHMLFGLSDMAMRRKFIDQENAGEDRKRREHQRLGALIGYCEAPGCRRQVLLSYFGETSEPCGNCDLCIQPGNLVDGTAEAKLALVTIRETGERYGAAHIVDILRGMNNEKVVAAGHARLATFGKGAARKREEWQSLLRQLVAAEFLKLDVAGYGGLSLGAKGRRLLQGEGAFGYRPLAPRTDTRKARREAAAAELTTSDNSLLAALKELRMGLARQRRVPAYVIFSDRTLIDMAQRRPKNETEFAEVHGVGAAKLKEFGATFLTAIRKAS